MEARNLRNMTMAQTPLLGDENTPMHVGPGGGSGFEGATPRHQVAYTPNPLATPREAITDTPGISATPLRTPLRDNLSINPEDFASSVGQTPRELRMRMSSTKNALKAGFMSLPKPENNFELLVPDDEELDAGTNATSLPEDAADRDAALQRRREEEEKKALARRSQSVQLGLPRPANVDLAGMLDGLNLDEEEDELSEADKLINAELVQLVQHDALTYPLPGTTKAGSSLSTYEMPDDESMDAAKASIQAELAALVGFPSATPSQLREGLLALAKTDPVSADLSWASERAKLVYSAARKAWVDPSTTDPEERAAGYANLLEDAREAMAKEAAKAGKLEKKLGKILGGYQARGTALAKRITTAFEEMQKSKIEYEAFSRLRDNESAIGPRRVEGLREEVEKLEQRERMLQMHYAELAAEKEDAESRVAALEEKVMAEAEALNEAQLAAMED